MLKAGNLVLAQEGEDGVAVARRFVSAKVAGDLIVPLKAANGAIIAAKLIHKKTYQNFIQPSSLKPTVR